MGATKGKNGNDAYQLSFNEYIDCRIQQAGHYLYAHYDENIEAGPLGYYEYGSPSVLFETDTDD